MAEATIILRANADQAEQEIRDLSETFVQLGDVGDKSSKEAADGLEDIEREAKKASRALEDSDKAASKWGQTLNTAANVATAGMMVATAAIGAIKGAVDGFERSMENFFRQTEEGDELLIQLQRRTDLLKGTFFRLVVGTDDVNEAFGIMERTLGRVEIAISAVSEAAEDTDANFESLAQEGIADTIEAFGAAARAGGVALNAFRLIQQSAITLGSWVAELAAGIAVLISKLIELSQVAMSAATGAMADLTGRLQEMAGSVGLGGVESALGSVTNRLDGYTDALDVAADVQSNFQLEAISFAETMQSDVTDGWISVLDAVQRTDDATRNFVETTQEAGEAIRAGEVAAAPDEEDDGEERGRRRVERDVSTAEEAASKLKEINETLNAVMLLEDEIAAQKRIELITSEVEAEQAAMDARLQNQKVFLDAQLLALTEAANAEAEIAIELASAMDEKAGEAKQLAEEERAAGRAGVEAQESFATSTIASLSAIIAPAVSRIG